MGDPKAEIVGSVYLVNTTNNAYEWFSPISITIGADGEWDESPDFPGLTNAYYQAIETTRDKILKPFSPASSPL